LLSPARELQDAGSEEMGVVLCVVVERKSRGKDKEEEGERRC
jgi:hypothetical protein